MASEVAVAVSATGVSIVGVETEAALAQFAYADIASWGYSSNAFVFVADQDDDEVEHVLKTTAVRHLLLIALVVSVTLTYLRSCQGKHINDLIAAYVKYILTLPVAT